MSLEDSQQESIGVASALIYKIQTMMDGGFRITLDLPDTEINLVKALLELKANPYAHKDLFVAFVKKAGQ